MGYFSHSVLVTEHVFLAKKGTILVRQMFQYVGACFLKTKILQYELGWPPNHRPSNEKQSFTNEIH